MQRAERQQSPAGHIPSIQRRITGSTRPDSPPAHTATALGAHNLRCLHLGMSHVPRIPSLRSRLIGWCGGVMYWSAIAGSELLIWSRKPSKRLISAAGSAATCRRYASQDQGNTSKRGHGDALAED